MSKDDLLHRVREREHHDACMCIQCKDTYQKNKRSILRKARRALKKLLSKEVSDE